MILVDHWYEAYLEPQQKEQSSVMFINQSPIIYQKFPGINLMGLGDPWADAYIEPQQKEQYYVIIINLETKQKEKSSVLFINKSPTTH